MSVEPWIQTRSGVAFDLLAPRVEDVKIGDIAHALARINRYSGHTSDAYSVAQHSVLCADLVAKWGAPPDVQRQALLHDAPEAYYGDASSPVQRAMRDAFRASLFNLAESLSIAFDTEALPHLLDRVVAWGETADPFTLVKTRIDPVVHETLGLPPELHALVKRADLVALAIERRDLMAPCERDWKLPEFAPSDVSISGTWSPYDSEPRFLARLKELDAWIERLAQP